MATMPKVKVHTPMSPKLSAGIIAFEVAGLTPEQVVHKLHQSGIIASVTAPFCAACDRTRLTADGQVRNCLFSQKETDLRGPMRAGATDDELARLIQGEMWRKAPGHGIGTADFAQPDRPMSAIGG